MNIGTESEPFYAEPVEDPFPTPLPEPERRKDAPLPDPVPATPQPIRAPAAP